MLLQKLPFPKPRRLYVTLSPLNDWLYSRLRMRNFHKDIYIYSFITLWHVTQQILLLPPPAENFWKKFHARKNFWFYVILGLNIAKIVKKCYFLQKLGNKIPPNHTRWKSAPSASGNSVQSHLQHSRYYLWQSNTRSTHAQHITVDLDANNNKAIATGDVYSRFSKPKKVSTTPRRKLTRIESVV